MDLPKLLRTIQTMQRSVDGLESRFNRMSTMAAGLAPKRSPALTSRSFAERLIGKSKVAQRRQLLESQGIIMPIREVAPADEIQNTQPAVSDVRTRLDAEEDIKNGFRKLIVGVIDGDDPIPTKLKKIEAYLKELEADVQTLRKGGKQTAAAKMTTEGFVTRLIGLREHRCRRQLLETKGR